MMPDDAQKVHFSRAVRARGKPRRICGPGFRGLGSVGSPSGLGASWWVLPCPDWLRPVASPSGLDADWGVLPCRVWLHAVASPSGLGADWGVLPAEPISALQCV